MSDIIFHRSSEKGKGLPFAILSSIEEPMLEEDLFAPSLRDFHVVFWFKKGVGKYYIDFQEYTYKPNTIVMVSKDQVHYFEKPEQDWELISIPFRSDFIYRNDNDLRHLFNFNISCHLEGQQVLQLKKEDADFLEDVVSYLRLVYYQWEGKARKDAFYHWLCIFLIYCEKLQEAPPIELLEQGGEDTQILLQFLDLLESHYKAERSVSFYIDQLHISLKVLARITQDRYKISPKQVINERVILEMKRLLRGSNRAIKQIAYELGFGEPTNMVKYFKKYTDMTPTAFREQ